MEEEHNKPLVSVIMPVYNSELYVEEAVDSILNQSLQLFELILVDDGSKDQSGLILDKIAERDKRVKVIHQENGGICNARNNGMAKAQGEYIAFCDNDDYYLQNLLKENYAIAKENNADCVRFLRMHRTLLDGSVVSETCTKAEHLSVESGVSLARNYRAVRKAGEGVWNGLYKNSFLTEHKIRFDETMKCGWEDLMFNISVYQWAQRVCVNPKVFYVWMQRKEHSTSQKFHINNMYSMKRCLIKEHQLVKSFYEKYGTAVNLGNVLYDAYLYEALRYMCLPTCNLSLKEKIGFLKELRLLEAFDKINNEQELKEIKSRKKTFFMYQTFMHKHFYVLYMSYYFFAKITDM